MDELMSLKILYMFLGFGNWNYNELNKKEFIKSCVFIYREIADNRYVYMFIVK